MITEKVDAVKNRVRRARDRLRVKVHTCGYIQPQEHENSIFKGFLKVYEYKSKKFPHKWLMSPIRRYAPICPPLPANLVTQTPPAGTPLPDQKWDQCPSTQIHYKKIVGLLALEARFK